MSRKWATILFGGIFMIWGTTGLVTWTQFPESQRGLLGDMFGAINALFSGPAFAGLIYTISLQRKELELQRTELQETREELRRSAIAQERHAPWNSLNTRIYAYQVMLDPAAGIRNRKISGQAISEEVHKKKCLNCLTELESLTTQVNEGEKQ